MLVVQVQLWPRGNYADAKQLGLMSIVNDGTGSKEVGNYNVLLKEDEKLYAGRVENWPRLNLPVGELVAAALQSVNRSKPMALAAPEPEGDRPDGRT